MPDIFVKCSVCKTSTMQQVGACVAFGRHGTICDSCGNLDAPFCTGNNCPYCQATAKPTPVDAYNRAMSII